MLKINQFNNADLQLSSLSAIESKQPSSDNAIGQFQITSKDTEGNCGWARSILTDSNLMR